ncbi:hypothetical protein [Thermostilla marina]
MPAVYPSSSNVYVPNLEASQRLIVDFARNVRDFAVSRYAQIMPVTKIGGLYLEMTVEEAGRILDTDLSQFVWYDNQPAPEGNDGLEAFEFKQFQCRRLAFSYSVGLRTVDNADWSILATQESIKARQAMTARTQAVVNEIFDPAKYPADHVVDCSSAKWNAATTTNLNIRKAVNAGIAKVFDATLGAVDHQNMILVMGDAVARAMSESQEIVDYLKGSPDALGALRYQFRDETPTSESFGLPSRLYGVEVVVDKTRKVTSKKRATTVREPVLPSNAAALVSRVGGLEAPYAPTSFSTCCLFMKEEMTVEQLQDTNNRRILGRVVEDYDAKLVAPATGVLFTNVV